MEEERTEGKRGKDKRQEGKETERPARERGVETVAWVKERLKKTNVKENNLFNSNFKMTNLLSQWTVVKQISH